ncbi:hypothetical protein CEXT_768691 [Caerostris extrusa]|uniref:Uncharacterized protein n=1 Tax=Caerostris extrusa TaxID=172846 RepID=A0AAV4Q0M1_CAEEX|nr:hypothetical protein CEXT_768691 [Caerostris extrusa]
MFFPENAINHNSTDFYFIKRDVNMAILTSLMLADTDYPTHKTDMIRPYSARSKSLREQFDCEITIHTLQSSNPKRYDA